MSCRQFRFFDMTEKNVHFKLKLAQIPVDVCCSYLSTKQYCRDYLVSDGEETEIQIVITQKDIAAEKAYLSTKKKKDEQLEASTPEALERLVLCRKVAEQMPRYDTVLFHGSGLALDGNGVLFTAVSGTGKSTHSGLWRRVFGQRIVMINDDKPFLTVKNEEIRMYGSPWRGKHRLGENTSAPVKAICILHRGEENAIERISPREAFPMLLQQTYHPSAPENMLQTVKLVEQLSKGVAMYRLFCNMEEEAAHVAYRGITFNREENDG